MGARGNVYITDSATEGYNAPHFEGGKRGIYLYSHWGGHELPADVQAALRAGRGRWSDDMYLTRILIDQITKDARDELTGYGVSLAMGDNSYPITVVDLGAQTVSFASPGNERDPSKWVAQTSFADFVKDGPASYPSGVAG
jgi:hypothetical protein